MFRTEKLYFSRYSLPVGCQNKVVTYRKTWEIFVLLALKIPFHFISLRKLENYLQFYMTIAFKLNRTKKKVHHKFEIAFNFKKEIPLKCFLSPLGDTLSPLGIVPFYIRNPFKIHLEQKKSSPKY